MQGYGGVAAYEFSDYENQTIKSTAKFARIWGVISIVSGVLLLVLAFGIMALAAGMVAALGAKGLSTGALMASLGPLGLVNIVCGVFYLQSGGALHNVVDTQGQDVPLLMSAMQTLSRAFMIETIATILAFVVGFGWGIASRVGG